MSTPNDPAIRSGAQHVDQTEQLTNHQSAPRDVSASESTPEDATDNPPVKTAVGEMILSMFSQGDSTRVRVGNPHNATELYEHAFPSPDEANTALLDAGILHPNQVQDPAALAGTGISLTGITAEQIEAAGLKRHGTSNL